MPACKMPSTLYNRQSLSAVSIFAYCNHTFSFGLLLNLDKSRRKEQGNSDQFPSINVPFSPFTFITSNYLAINDISNKSEEVWDILFSRLFTNFAKKDMEKENIITVDIEDFKDSQHVLDYIDDDFAIVNSLEGTPYSNDTTNWIVFSSRFA